MNVCMCMCIYMYTLYSLKRPRNNDHFLEKWLIPDLEQELYQRSIEHLDTPDSKDAIKEF